MRLRGMLLIGVLGLCLPVTFLARPPRPTPPASLAEILNDRELWGKDLPAALALSSSWSRVGERTLAVFPGRILGATPYNTPQDAQRAASQMARAMSEAPPRPSPEFADLLARGRAKQAIPFRATLISLVDDDAVHLAWADSSVEFLPPNLTLASVKNRFGEPERVTQEIVPTQRDRRPVVLTLYQYAGGAVSFAESDAAQKPGIIDRVLFDVPAVTAALFGQAGAAAPVSSAKDGVAALNPVETTRNAAQTAPAEPAQATLVDVASDATDPANLGDTEPSIAVNPANPLEIAIVTFSERWSSTAMAPVWKSSDAGATWRKVFQIPEPAPGLGGPGDQKIAFDAAGNIFIAELGGGGVDFIYSQTADPDDPLTPGAPYGSDQPHLDVDKSPASSCFGQLYSPWLNFGVSPERSTVSFSSTGGAQMTDVAAGDNSAFPNRTTRIALAPNGNAYIVYKTREGPVVGDFQNAHFRVSRSDNCGATWDALGVGGASVHGPDAVQTFFTTTFGNPAKGKVARARSSDAWIAVSSLTANAYVAYVSRDDSAFGQIYVALSTDQGATWTSSRVTDGTHHSAYPEIAVADNETLGVLYIDYDDSGPNTIFRHHFARSFDGGATWTDEILQSMDPTPLPNAANGFLWGDYEGLTALGNIFYGVFTGESIDRTTPQLDPIFFTETAEAGGAPKTPRLAPKTN